MSADNWTVCPRCLHLAELRENEERQRVAYLYGKVPVEEFDEARRVLAEQYVVDRDDRKFQTFAEYYEFYGAREGEITAHHSGNCKACGLKCEFDHVVKFWGPEDRL